VPSIHLARARSTQWHHRGGRVRELLSRSAETERCCPSHSPALRPWIAVSASYVEGIWSPALLLASEKEQAKATGNSAANSACAKRRGAFLS
jgi:hypothetical protein